MGWNEGRESLEFEVGGVFVVCLNKGASEEVSECEVSE